MPTNPGFLVVGAFALGALAIAGAGALSALMLSHSRRNTRTNTMDFGQAVAALKAGQRVAREGWNGKGMWLTLVPGSTFTVQAGRPMAAALPVGTEVTYLPHIDMFTAQGALVPWLASQSDVLAEDWMVVDAASEHLLRSPANAERLLAAIGRANETSST